MQAFIGTRPVTIISTHKDKLRVWVRDDEGDNFIVLKHKIIYKEK